MSQAWAVHAPAAFPLQTCLCSFLFRQQSSGDALGLMEGSAGYGCGVSVQSLGPSSLAGSAVQTFLLSVARQRNFSLVLKHWFPLLSSFLFLLSVCLLDECFHRTHFHLSTLLCPHV